MSIPQSQANVNRMVDAIKLPLDAGGNPIPAVAIRPGGSHNITAGSATGTNTTPFRDDTVIVSVFVDGDDGVFMEFGDSSVEATSSSHFFPGKIYYDFALKKGWTHVAVLRADATDQEVYISEKY